MSYHPYALPPSAPPQYGHLAAKAGITNFVRAPALNDEPLLARAQAEVIAGHLARGVPAETPQYALNCPTCDNPACRTVLNPVGGEWNNARALRDPAAPKWPTEADVAALKARTSECP